MPLPLRSWHVENWTVQSEYHPRCLPRSSRSTSRQVQDWDIGGQGTIDHPQYLVGPPWPNELIAPSEDNSGSSYKIAEVVRDHPLLPPINVNIVVKIGTQPHSASPSHSPSQRYNTKWSKYSKWYSASVVKSRKNILEKSTSSRFVASSKCLVKTSSSTNTLNNFFTIALQLLTKRKR